MDMTIYDDQPKDQEGADAKAKPYRGFQDQHDYGQSDNEEQWNKRATNKKSAKAEE